MSAFALDAAGAGAGAGGAGQGNPLAMRALMEALGASAAEQQRLVAQMEGGGLGGGGSEDLLLGEVGASGEERAALLEAFAGLRCVARVCVRGWKKWWRNIYVVYRTAQRSELTCYCMKMKLTPSTIPTQTTTTTTTITRDLYLAASRQRLRRPVEQMFPTKEGFQAAMPSKHDLQAFSRAAQAELLAALAEGGAWLLPSVAAGVGEAVALFCEKVEGMMKTGEGARKLFPLRGWVLSPEKEHNLQLLQLVAFLHQALRRLPRDLAAAALDPRGLVGGGGSGHAHAGGVGSGSLGDRELEAACAALEALAVGGFIQPYLADIANELGGVSGVFFLFGRV